MQVATKVVFNTVVLYVKILVSMSIALITVPLVLKALGASDYGLYNLVVGIATMLTFLNNSMTISSQRFMSVAMGEGDQSKINGIYNTSFTIHLFLAICIAVTLEIIGVPSIRKLNIDPNRVWCANLIFQFLIINTSSHIIAVPFDAIMNAHEDLLASSIIGIIADILMLVMALTLQCISIDKLAFYGFYTAVVALLALMMKWIWCSRSYKNYHLAPYKFSSKPILKEMLGFTGWNLFGSLALMGRNQGVTIVFNIFMGTMANAAYGVANQLNSAMSQFSSTFQKAINPQLMKSEGMGDKGRLQRISIISSKFSVLALCLFSVPLIILMEDVLNIWLHEKIPPFTIELSRCILILTIVYQLSTGLMSSIQATGKIKWYQITMGCIILLNVPASYVILKLQYPIYYVTIFFIILECLSLIVRLSFAKRIVGISPKDFFIQVILPIAIIVLISSSFSMIPFAIFDRVWYRLILVSACYGACYMTLVWLFVIDKSQQQIIINKAKHFLHS